MLLSGVSETNWSRLTRGLTSLTEYKGHEKLTFMKEREKHSIRRGKFIYRNEVNRSCCIIYRKLIKLLSYFMVEVHNQG